MTGKRGGKREKNKNASLIKHRLELMNQGRVAELWKEVEKRHEGGKQRRKNRRNMDAGIVNRNQAKNSRKRFCSDPVQPS